MTKRKWLVALLIGSSIGCCAGTDQSSAQSLARLKYRLHVLPEQCTAEASCAAGGLANPLSINNRDWVAGLVNPPAEQPVHPALWRRTRDSRSGSQAWRLTDLGTLGGPNAAIESPNKNEIGWLVGASETAGQDPNSENFCSFDCAPLPSCSFTNICRGFLWRGETNKMIALPPLPGRINSHATASNNNRQIAGIAEYGMMGSNCASPQVFLYKGVVWSLDASGAPYIQETLPPVQGDAESQASAMNDAGTVVGASGPCGPPLITVSGMHAVLWKDGKIPRVLGTLGGTGASAGAINERGQVVGVSFLAGDAITHPFLWQEDVGMKDLGSLLPDDTLVFPDSINNRGEVVGWSCGPSEAETPYPCGPLYWRKGMKQPIDLNQVTQSPHLGICCASDINESGEIVVAVFDPNYNGGDIRAAVLIPEHDEDEQNASQALPPQSAAAIPPSALPSDFLQRFGPRGLRGWKPAR